MTMGLLSPFLMGSPQRLGGLLGQPPQPQQTVFPPAPPAPMSSPSGGFGSFGNFGSGEPNYALMALGQGIANGNVGGAFQQYAPLMAANQSKNKTRQWLVSKGMSPEDADVYASDPVLLREVLQGSGKKDEFGDRAKAAQLYGLDPNSEEGKAFILTGNLPSGRFGVAEAGLTPYPVMGKDGKIHMVQPTKSGQSVEMALPQGLEGDYLGPYDKAQAQAAGRIAGESQGALPGAEQLVGDLELQINSIKNDPYLPSMLGSVPFSGGYLTRSRLPNMSAEAGRVQSKIDQLQGGAFLQARQALKGGGQITDYEGQKAEAAYSRLETAQSVQDFKDALDEFEYWAKRGLTKLQKQAGQTPTTIQPPPSLGGGSGPAVGTVDGGYRFKGGNPADPNSWEPAQ